MTMSSVAEVAWLSKLKLFVLFPSSLFVGEKFLTSLVKAVELL